MKINNLAYSKNISISNRMGINMSNPHIYSYLTDKLYKEKHKSIVRELISNAIDATNSIPEQDRKAIEISYLNGNFSIQDFGVGMTLETVLETFFNYFNSDKTGNENQIGGFGIGGKTPLLYTDSFTIETTSPDDGIRRMFIAYQDTNGIPKYDYVDEMDILDSNIKGSKFYFKLKSDDDLELFLESLKIFHFSSTPIKLFINNVETPISKYSVYNSKLKHNENFIITRTIYERLSNKHIYTNNKNNLKIHVVLGDVLYEYNLDTKNCSKLLDLIEVYDLLDTFNHSLNYNNINKNKDLYFVLFNKNNGEITLTLSREEIEDSESNKKIIHDLLFENLQNEISNKFTTFNDDVIKLGTLYSNDGSICEDFDDYNNCYKHSINLTKLFYIEGLFNFYLKNKKHLSSFKSTHKEIKNGIKNLLSIFKNNLINFDFFDIKYGAGKNFDNYKESFEKGHNLVGYTFNDTNSSNNKENLLMVDAQSALINIKLLLNAQIHIQNITHSEYLRKFRNIINVVQVDKNFVYTSNFINNPELINKIKIKTNTIKSNYLDNKPLIMIIKSKGENKSNYLLNSYFNSLLLWNHSDSKNFTSKDFDFIFKFNGGNYSHIGKKESQINTEINYKQNNSKSLILPNEIGLHKTNYLESIIFNLFTTEETNIKLLKNSNINKEGLGISRTVIDYKIYNNIIPKNYIIDRFKNIIFTNIYVLSKELKSCLKDIMSSHTNDILTNKASQNNYINSIDRLIKLINKNPNNIFLKNLYNNFRESYLFTNEFKDYSNFQVYKNIYSIELIEKSYTFISNLFDYIYNLGQLNNLKIISSNINTEDYINVFRNYINKDSVIKQLLLIIELEKEKENLNEDNINNLISNIKNTDEYKKIDEIYSFNDKFLYQISTNNINYEEILSDDTDYPIKIFNHNYMNYLIYSFFQQLNK